MGATQFVAAKIGIVTGVGVVGVFFRNYPHWIGYSAALSLALACTINAGVDIGAIAAAFNLIVPISATVLVVPIAAIIVALQLWGSYRFIAKLFKWLAFVLLAYIGAALLAPPNAAELLRHPGLPPIRFDPQFLLALVPIPGATISPY